MNQAGNFVVFGLSRLLEPETRAVILGDLAELNLGLLRSVSELCGLIARQQASLWGNWRPWAALLGVAGLVGLRLTYLAGLLMAAPVRYIRTYVKYGVIYENGLSLTEELIVFLSLALAVAIWSWTAGFAFASLSGKAAFVTGLVLCLVWLSWNVLIAGFILFHSPRLLPLLLIPCLFFFVPAFGGARWKVRGNNVSRRQIIVVLAVTVTFAALVTWTSGWEQAGLERWSEGAVHGGTPWYRRVVSPLLLSWPAFWIAASRYCDLLSKSKFRRFSR